LLLPCMRDSSLSKDGLISVPESLCHSYAWALSHCHREESVAQHLFWSFSNSPSGLSERVDAVSLGVVLLRDKYWSSQTVPPWIVLWASDSLRIEGKERGVFTLGSLESPFSRQVFEDRPLLQELLEL
jgi:hypothetical protein